MNTIKKQEFDDEYNKISQEKIKEYEKVIESWKDQKKEAIELMNKKLDIISIDDFVNIDENNDKKEKDILEFNGLVHRIISMKSDIKKAEEIKKYINIKNIFENVTKEEVEFLFDPTKYNVKIEAMCQGITLNYGYRIPTYHTLLLFEYYFHKKDKDGFVNNRARDYELFKEFNNKVLSDEERLNKYIKCYNYSSTWRLTDKEHFATKLYIHENYYERMVK